MTRRPLLEGFATLILMAAGTWLAGWWAVPILALIAGAAAIRPVFVAGAASLSWALLLVLDAAQGPLGQRPTLEPVHAASTAELGEQRVKLG